MRDYALHQVSASGSLPGTGFVERFLRNWAARRAVRRLDAMDDHMLRDIGLTRADVDWALQLPLSVNAALLLDDRARRNGFRR